MSEEPAGKTPHSAKPSDQAPGRRGAENIFRVVDMQPGLPRHAIALQEEQILSTSYRQLRRSYDFKPRGHCSAQSIAHRLATLSSNLRQWSTNRSQRSIISSETIATFSASHALPIGCDTRRGYFRTTCTSDTAVPAPALHVERSLQATTRFQCYLVSMWSDACTYSCITLSRSAAQ